MKAALTLNTIRRRSMTEYNGMITAKVEGTHTYTVKLLLDNGEAKHSCTCPMGDEDIFCKHCVAVGLAWIEGGSKEKAKKVVRLLKPRSRLKT